MFSRLRENLLYKVLALVCAAIIHFYVVGQVNPHQSRPFTMTPAMVNVPDGLLVDEKSVPSVTINVDGATDEINHLTASSIKGIVDLTNAHVGRNIAERVLVELPADTRNDVTTDVQPGAITVILKPQRKRVLPIIASYPGTPPVGYTYHTPVVTPHEATIMGDDDTVNSVAQLMVKVDNSGTAGTVDNDFTIVPLDSHGNEVGGVTLSPTTTHVRIGIMKVPAMRSLIISPAITGTVPFPYKIASVTAVPSSVVVSGRPNQLASVGTINTAPMDVSGAMADVTRSVTLVPEQGLIIAKPVLVRVTVHIVTEQPSTLPTSTPPPATP